MVKVLSEGDCAGKRALVRVDFNAPLRNGKVSDDTRLRAALPTIEFLVQAGAKVILMSHLGRPKGHVVPELSLAPVARALTKLGVPCKFVSDCVGPDAEAAVAGLQPGNVLLLENLRFHPEEAANDDAFAMQLARHGDLFVSDAFGTAHRAHASTVGVAAHLPAFPGQLIAKELDMLNGLMERPQRPFVAILGGAKVSDKILVIERLLEKVDRLIIGGGMAFTFLRAQGHDVGKSLVEEEKVELAKELLARAEAKGVELLLPVDVEEAETFDRKSIHRAVKVTHMDPDWRGLDIGPLTMAKFVDAIQDAGSVLWNGPMGVFEWEPFKFGTLAVAKAVAKCPGITIVGGGDSAAAAKLFGVSEQVSHVSTGGGACLALLEGKTLPGLAVLE